MRRLMMFLGVLALVASPAIGAGVSLLELPALEGATSCDARNVTPDGGIVIGVHSGKGTIWDAVNGPRWIISSDGAGASNVSGLGVREVDGQPQLVVHGMSAGFSTNWFSDDGGVTWNKKLRDTSVGGSPSTGVAGTMRAVGGSSDVFYNCWVQRSGSTYIQYMEKISGGGDPPSFESRLQKSANAKMYNTSISATNRAVGHRKATKYRNYVGNAGSWSYVLGLDGTYDGENWSISDDGNRVGGRSWVLGGDTGMWPHLIENPGASQTITPLPTLTTPAGVYGTYGLVYGLDADGSHGAGMDYSQGMERAVHYDLSDANPANWSVTDLTQLATDAGVLGKFTYNLRRAYGVATNPDNGDVYIVGNGVINDPVQYRGYLMTICSQPIILAAVAAPEDPQPYDFTVQKKDPGKARLPIDLYGSAELDCADLDLDSIKVAGVVIPVKVQNDVDLNGDGISDLKIHVNRRELIDALALDAEIGNVVDVVVTGAHVSGCPIIEATAVIAPQAP